MFIEDEVLNLVIEYDVNGDGTIDFDEFMEMMKKQAEHQVNYLDQLLATFVPMINQLLIPAGY